MLSRVSPLALSVIGAIVALSILGAIAAVLLINAGNANGAAIVLGFLAPTVTSLLVLIRAESNASNYADMHTMTQSALTQLSSKVDGVATIASNAASAGASAATAAQAAQQSIQDKGSP